MGQCNMNVAGILTVEIYLSSTCEIIGSEKWIQVWGWEMVWADDGKSFKLHLLQLPHLHIFFFIFFFIFFIFLIFFIFFFRPKPPSSIGGVACADNFVPAWAVLDLLVRFMIMFGKGYYDRVPVLPQDLLIDPGYDIALQGVDGLTKNVYSLN